MKSGQKTIYHQWSMEFQGKNEDFVAEWLQREGFKERVVETFRDNEVDGDGFLMLDTEQIRQLVPQIGPQAKLLQKHSQILETLAPLTASTVSPTKRAKSALVPVEDDTNNDMTSNSTSGEEDENPAKRLKTESDSALIPFQLENDKKSKAVPDPFPFPENYPPNVECALLAKVVPPAAMRRFLTSIARALYNIKCYPTASEYESISVQIIQRYPFMRSPAGCPYVHLELVIKMLKQNAEMAVKLILAAVPLIAAEDWSKTQEELEKLVKTSIMLA